VFISCWVSASAYAAFGGFLPLHWSGQVTYSYAYTDNSGSESETTNLLVGTNAVGYIWRPWFATTSLALNVGLSNTETTTSSSDSTVGAGSFSLSVFPRSRFPFALSYSRTDSRSQQFQEASSVSGESNNIVTRLTLRQTYRPRAYSQLYNAFYTATDYDGETYGSKNVSYGLDYSLRVSKQTFEVSGTHLETEVRDVEGKPMSDVLSVTYVYTPSPELGVNSLFSYVEVDPGSGTTTSADSQAFGAFHWRPEHRAVSVSGGVRLSETKTEGTTSTVSRNLNTNLGLGYRITRALNLSADASVGTSESANVQTLSTTQSVNLIYSGGQTQFAGYRYGWHWNGSASNSTTRTETSGNTTSDDHQSYSTGIGHNLGKSWATGRSSSLSMNLGQSFSGSKSSGKDVMSKTLNHSAGTSWSARGKRGSVYLSGHVSDSRTYGETDSVFDNLGVNLSSEYGINRLSNMSGNLNFSASQSENEDDTGAKITSGSRLLSGSLSYRHGRPFGVYNLRFDSSLTGSKQIDSPQASATLRWEGGFQYSLGLLSTSLRFRATETPGGKLTKSMNFQATRSF
jgi:hypothetical protein